MTDKIDGYKATTQLRWVRAASAWDDGQVKAKEDDRPLTLQQLFVSDFVGEPEEWRDVPIVVVK